MSKVFSGEKILSPVEMGPRNGVFWENGGRNLRFWFRVEIGASVLAAAFLKNPKKVAESLGARNHACAEPKPLNRFG